MSSMASISIDPVQKTAVNSFTINGSIVNNVSFKNNQIVFAPSPYLFITSDTMSSIVQNIFSFKNAVALNFPVVQSLATVSVGPCSFSMSCSASNAKPYLAVVNYLYRGPGPGNSSVDVQSFSFDQASTMFNIEEIKTTTSVSWSSFITYLFYLNRYMQEILAY